MQIIFRILDFDFHRAQRVEMQLLSSIRAHGIEAHVYQVLEHLEISRTGVTSLPALELNGIILYQGVPLTEELLDDVCLRLVTAKEKLQKNKVSQNVSD
ncbi:MAG: hypothetical protein HKO68_02775 [Desulfobacterales bacterium]|nr:hypothetical protein [Desulfobacterales bacterium]